MRAYSMDLRERVLLDSEAGMKAADVAAKYRVSGSWVRLLKQRLRDTGEVAPRVQRHGRRCMLEPYLHTLADLIAAHQDRTLAELKDALATPASVPTVWRAVRALGLTVKKRSARPNTIVLTSRQRGSLADQHVACRVAGHGADRPGGLRRRDRWRELSRLHRTDPGADPATKRHRHRRQPRGPQGRRHAARPPGRRGHTLVLATL